MTETTKYYEVIAKCGHVGRKHYVPIKFAVITKDGKEVYEKICWKNAEKLLKGQL